MDQQLIRDQRFQIRASRNRSECRAANGAHSAGEGQGYFPHRALIFGFALSGDRLDQRQQPEDARSSSCRLSDISLMVMTALSNSFHLAARMTLRASHDPFTNLC